MVHNIVNMNVYENMCTYHRRMYSHSQRQKQTCHVIEN